MLDQSAAYGAFPDELEGNRLDYVYHHPIFEPVRAFRRSKHSLRMAPIITTPEYGLSLSGSPTGDRGFLNVQHISPLGHLVFDPPTFIDYDGDKVLKQDDLIIARTGFTLGKAAPVTLSFTGYAFGSFCLRFRVDQETYRTEFVARFLNSNLGRMQTLMLRTGSDKPNINSEQVQDLYLPALGLEKQDEVLAKVHELEATAADLDRQASILRAEIADELVRALDLLDVLREGTYFYKDGAEGRSLWFTRPPDALADRLHYLFYHPRYDTALAALRDRYATVALGEIVAEPIRRGVQPDYDEDGEVAVLKTVDLRGGWIDYDGALRVSRAFSEANEGAQVRRGDVLVTATGYGSMGKVDVYDRDEPALISGELLAFTPSADYDPYFLCYFLRSRLGAAQFDRWFSGSSGQIHLYEADLSQFVVPSAGEGGVSLEAQRRIAETMTRKLERARALEFQAEARREKARRRFEALVLGTPAHA